MRLKRHLTLAFWRRLVETRANAERNRVNGRAGWWSQGCPSLCKATTSAAAAASSHLLPAWARSFAGAPTLHVLTLARICADTFRLCQWQNTVKLSAAAGADAACWVAGGWWRRAPPFASWTTNPPDPDTTRTWRRMSVHIIEICIGYRRPAEAGAQSQLAHLGSEVE